MLAYRRRDSRFPSPSNRPPRARPRRPRDRRLQAHSRLHRRIRMSNTTASSFVRNAALGGGRLQHRSAGNRRGPVQTARGPSSTVVSVSGGGFARDQANAKETRLRRVTMRYGRLRAVVRTWSINGRDQAWDDDARRWLGGRCIIGAPIACRRSESIYRFPRVVRTGRRAERCSTIGADAQ